MVSGLTGGLGFNGWGLGFRVSGFGLGMDLRFRVIKGLRLEGV